MLPDLTPIVFNTPQEFETIEIYPLHDIHYGNSMFNISKWNRLKAEILSEPNRYCIIVGDFMENAIPGSKSDMFTQTATPEEQKEWVAEQMKELADRIILIIPGNHETNRTTKVCGLFPLYDCALIAGVKDKYRQCFAFVDIGVGKGHKKTQQNRYVGYAMHKAKDCKNYSSADMIDGIDFFLFGHDHDAKDHPRGKLKYDAYHKAVVQHDVEVLNCGSFMDYGGYAAEGAYRPNNTKYYKMILSGKGKDIQTLGYHL